MEENNRGIHLGERVGFPDREEKYIQPRELRIQLGELRTQVDKETRLAIEHRIKQNPSPTQQELTINAFVEELEPQVREAVLVLNEKGYKTVSSGLYDDGQSIHQSIDGLFTLDDETKTKLQSIGIIIKPHQKIPGYIFLKFYPQEPDLDKMKAKWDEVASILKPTGTPVPPPPLPPGFSGSEILVARFRDTIRRRYGKSLPQLKNQASLH